MTLLNTSSLHEWIGCIIRGDTTCGLICAVIVNSNTSIPLLNNEGCLKMIETGLQFEPEPSSCPKIVFPPQNDHFQSQGPRERTVVIIT